MRILIVHSLYRVRGGEDRYVEEQAELLSRNHHVHLHLRRNDEVGRGRAAAALIGVGTDGSELDGVVRSFRPDLIHVHNVFPTLGPSVHRVAERSHVPLVMTVHNFRLRCPNGFAFTEGEICERCVGGNVTNAVIHHCFESGAQAATYASAVGVHRFILRLERRVALFLAISDFVNEKLCAWGIPGSKVKTVRSFTRRFPDSPPGSESFGIYAGRLSPEKGVDVLLRALAEAGDPPFKVVGDGPLLRDLVALKGQLSLSNTEFTGRLDTAALDKLLLRARYAVMPSVWNEPGGLAAMEAMAAGRPVIVSDRGALPELVMDSGGGFVTAARDVSGLAHRIRELAADDGLCVEMGAKGRGYARAHLSKERHLQAITDSYREVLASFSARNNG
jgi:glycosyltransferase involved in cell wall biosynthesis